MANSWGFDNSQYYPGFPSAYVRMKLGWTVPMTPVAGTNIIANAELASPNNGTPQIYKIGQEFGFKEGEYLLIENRQLYGLDSILPQSGLAIYHVDENAGLDEEGYPGQDGWPRNGLHYRVALLQADGLYHLEKGTNKGGRGDFFRGDKVNQLLPSDNALTGPFPNTDAYQDRLVFQTGVLIYDISLSGDIMTFGFSHPTAPAPGLPSRTPSRRPSLRPSNRPSLRPSSTPS